MAIANVELVLPAATVTDAGIVAATLLLLNDITAPPAGAAALNVTVPVDPVPPVTLAGFTLTEVREAEDTGITVSVAVRVAPL